MDEDLVENFIEEFGLSNLSIAGVTAGVTTGVTIRSHTIEEGENPGQVKYVLKISRNLGIKNGDILTVRITRDPYGFDMRPSTRNFVFHAAPAPTPEVLGRVAGRDHVSTYDAMLLVRHIINPAQNPITNFAAADIDGDGHITMDDVVLLMQWLAGHNVSNLLAINR
jgi:hypothetical protein